MDLPENFNRPWLSQNIQNFWQRWHISLGRLVNKSIYIPIIRKFGRVNEAILITFLLIGIWHEFSWNYVAWGFLHATGLIVHRLYEKSTLCRKEFIGLPILVMQPVKIIFTLTYVGILSIIANSAGMFGF